MKLEINDQGIIIWPETTQDEIYIETVLGLKKEWDITRLIRTKPTAVNSWHLYIPKKLIKRATDELNTFVVEDEIRTIVIESAREYINSPDAKDLIKRKTKKRIDDLLDRSIDSLISQVDHAIGKNTYTD